MPGTVRVLAQPVQRGGSEEPRDPAASRLALLTTREVSGADRQNARTVWIIAPQPFRPAVYGVKAPLYGALLTRNSSVLSQSRSVGRKCHFTPPPNSRESPNSPRTHDARPYGITFLGLTK